jgi:hypothetical protein
LGLVVAGFVALMLDGTWALAAVFGLAAVALSIVGGVRNGTTNAGLVAFVGGMLVFLLACLTRAVGGGD